MYNTCPTALAEDEGIWPIRSGAHLLLRLKRREADRAAPEYTQTVTVHCRWITAGSLASLNYPTCVLIAIPLSQGYVYSDINKQVNKTGIGLLIEINKADNTLD